MSCREILISSRLDIVNTFWHYRQQFAVITFLPAIREVGVHHFRFQATAHGQEPGKRRRIALL